MPVTLGNTSITSSSGTLEVVGTGSIKLPAGTTAQRPASSVVGMIRYNTSTVELEVFDGIGWSPISAWNDLQPLGDTSQIAGWGFENNLTDFSGTQTGTGINISYQSGIFGQSTSYNGSNSRVLFPSSLVPSGDSARSVSVWVNLSSSKTSRQLVYGSGRHGTNSSVFDIEANVFNSAGVSGRWGIHWWGDGRVFQSSAAAVVYDQWVHVVVTHAGGNLGVNTKLYLNGNYISDLSGVSQSFNTSSGSGMVHEIGWRSFDSNLGVNGRIDQLRLFNRAIQASEISRIYTAGR